MPLFLTSMTIMATVVVVVVMVAAAMVAPAVAVLRSPLEFQL
jgi:hypothetical protein